MITSDLQLLTDTAEAIRRAETVITSMKIRRAIVRSSAYELNALMRRAAGMAQELENRSNGVGTPEPKP